MRITRLIRLLPVLCICLMFSTYLLTQQSSTQSVSAPAGVQEAAQQPVSKAGPSPADEANMLRAELRIIKENYGHMLSTVYWALGALISVTIAVAVLGWYMNFRLYERDKESMRRELKLLVAQSQAQILEAMQNRIASIDKQVNELVRVSVGNAESTLKAAAQGAISRLRADLTHVQYDLAEIQGKTYEQQRSMLGAWQRYRDMLRFALQMGESWVGYPIDHLKRLLTDGVRLSHHYVLEITELLSKLPTGYAGDVETITNMVKAAREPAP